MTAERKAGHTLGRAEPVTALVKARNARKPRPAPKYRLHTSDVALPESVPGSKLHGTLHVDRPADLRRAMDHWLGVWQHANPSITYDDLDPRKAHWFRLNVPE